MFAKLYLLRLLNNLVTTFSNMVPTICATYILIGFNEQVTYFTVMNVLCSSLSVIQWERSGQAKYFNDFWYSAFLSLIVVSCTLIFDAVLGFEFDVLEYAAIAIAIIVSCNIQILCNFYSTSLSRLAWYLQFLRAAFSVNILIFIYLFPVASFASFIWNYLAFTIVTQLLLMLITKKNIIIQPSAIDLNGLFFVMSDFLKNQTWLIFLRDFSSTISSSQIYFIRQLLGPIAILLSTHRMTKFDINIRHGSGSVEPGQIYYMSSLLIGMAFLIAGVILVKIGLAEIDSLMVAMAWLFLILSQDIRAYYTRKSYMTVITGLLTWILLILPFLVVFGISKYYQQLSVAALIFSNGAGELLAVGTYYFMWSEHAKKRKTDSI